jgi:hypothetical protein
MLTFNIIDFIVEDLVAILYNDVLRIIVEIIGFFSVWLLSQ